MKEKIRDYFTFTRKERLGVIVLLIIILILFIVPYWIRRPPGTEDPEATRQFAPFIQKMEKDSTGREAYGEKGQGYDPERAAFAEKSGNNGKSPVPAKLFYFNPNELEESDWQRLGLSVRQSRTLVHYTGKGGKFRSAADLEKIYGLSVADRERLLPYVRIPSSGSPRRNVDVASQRDRMLKPWKFDSYQDERKFALLKSQKRRNPETRDFHEAGDYSSPQRHYPKKNPFRIDINRADSQAWQQLPGIGEKLAARIIRFRERLGGFYSVDQVGETFGLPDSSFQKIRPWLQTDSAAIQLIDLNSASGETLRQHPYIRWKLANALLRYREQHGKFVSLDELGQLALLDAQTIEKLKPYLEISK